MFSGIYKAVHKLKLNYTSPSEQTINSVNLFYINLLFFFKEVYFYKSNQSLQDNFQFCIEQIHSGSTQKISEMIIQIKKNRDKFVAFHAEIKNENKIVLQNKISIILQCEDYLKCAFDIKQQYPNLTLLNLNLANSQRMGGVASYDVGSAEETWCRLSDLFLVMLFDHITDDMKKSQMLLFILENLQQMIKTGNVPITQKNYSTYANKMTELLHDIEVIAYKIDFEHPHYNPIVITRDPYNYQFENIIPREKKPFDEHYTALIKIILAKERPLLGQSAQFFLGSGTDKAAVDHRSTALFDRAASNENILMNFSDTELVMKATIQQIIDEVYRNKIDVINLSAFGCGAFKGDPVTVAGYFRDKFIEPTNIEKLEGKIIHFGIYTDNFYPFAQVLHALKGDSFAVLAIPDKSIAFTGDKFCFMNDSLGNFCNKSQVTLQFLCEDALSIPSDVVVLAVVAESEEQSQNVAFFKEDIQSVFMRRCIQQQSKEFSEEINRLSVNLSPACVSNPIKMEGNICSAIIVKLTSYSSNLEMKKHLKSAYQSALQVAHDSKLQTLTFPLFVEGKNKISVQHSAEIAAEAFKDFLFENKETCIKSIILTLNPKEVKAREFHNIKEIFREIIFQPQTKSLYLKL